MRHRCWLALLVLMLVLTLAFAVQALAAPTKMTTATVTDSIQASITKAAPTRGVATIDNTGLRAARALGVAPTADNPVAPPTFLDTGKATAGTTASDALDHFQGSDHFYGSSEMYPAKIAGLNTGTVANQIKRSDTDAKATSVAMSVTKDDYDLDLAAAPAHRAFI